MTIALPARVCPRCFKPFPVWNDLAAHLAVAHDVGALAAIAEARGSDAPPPSPTPATSGATPTATKETPMPTGVYARKSDPTKPCGYCKQSNAAHKAWCKRGTRKATKPAKGRPAQPANGGDPIAAIRAALLHLEAELTGVRALKAELAKALGL